MVVLLTVLHATFCVFLILVILLQTGKGGGMGVAFGGASQTVFGPRGAGSFVGKATGIVAALFMITSMVLAFVSSSGGTGVADKAGALAEKRAGQVEEVDLSQAATESSLPPDGQSGEPEATPSEGAGDGGSSDAGGSAASDAGGVGVPSTDVGSAPVAADFGTP
jgi:preprotein translocase subunit SecG